MNQLYCYTGKALTGTFNKLSLMACCHAAITLDLTQTIFTYSDPKFLQTIGAFWFYTLSQKMGYPGFCALAQRGVVLARRKSLELIMRKVCSRGGGETADQQDIVKMKAWGKTGQKTRDKQTEMFLL